MSASEWLKKNAPPEVQAEVQENFRFALEQGLKPMERLRKILIDAPTVLIEDPRDMTANDILTIVADQLDSLHRVTRLINNPQTDDFQEAVYLEAASQVERWRVNSDSGKSPEDWLFLMGYLGTKACQALRRAISQNDDLDGHREHEAAIEEAKHHIISSAASCLNWHGALSNDQDRSSMRPGIEPPDEDDK